MLTMTIHVVNLYMSMILLVDNLTVEMGYCKLFTFCFLYYALNVVQYINVKVSV